MEYILAILVIILMPAFMYLSYMIMIAPVILFIGTIGVMVDVLIDINKKIMKAMSPLKTDSKPIPQLIEE